MPSTPTVGNRIPEMFHAIGLSDSSKTKFETNSDNTTSATAPADVERRTWSAVWSCDWSEGAPTHFELREFETAAKDHRSEPIAR